MSPRPEKSRRNSGMRCTKLSPRDHQILQTEQRIQPCGVLGKSPVAHLPQAKQILDDVKRMLDLGTNARLELLKLVEDATHRVVRQCSAFAGSHRDMPTGLYVLLRISLFNALVTRITEYKFLFAVQQLVRNAHISRVGRRRDQRVRQARLGIRTNVGLHPEVPEVALLRLMHLRIAFAVTVPVEEGTAIIVASTTVPPRIISRRPCNIPETRMNTGLESD